MAKKVHLKDIADKLGVSIKTVSGALHGDSVRMSDATRQAIRDLARELGYQPNIVARGMRQGVMPIIGLVAEGLITLPFATEIVRSLDNAGRSFGLSMVATNVGASRSTDAGIEEIQRFMPKAVAFATMFHREVKLSADALKSIDLMINCFDASGAVPAIVPDDVQAARDIVAHCFARGRRRIAFLNLPGILAGALREEGFRAAHREQDVPVTEAWLLPATRGASYSEFSASLVDGHIERLMSGPERPDTILCGNDRVAIEVYFALNRLKIAVPHDVAVASFDNQAEIARRLDPPLTTMALPHRAMGRRAAEILAGRATASADIERIPFRLIERASL